jgi:hypothetical protein
MLGRFLLAGLCVSVGTTAFAASTAISETGASEPIERLRITCVGTMATAGVPPPGSSIVADGLIDFVDKRVRGFGVGSQPIEVVTISEIDFGSSPPGEGRGNIVSGSIDRQSGNTRIVVRSALDPSDIRIEMRLDCDFERPVSQSRSPAEWAAALGFPAAICQNPRDIDHHQHSIE